MAPARSHATRLRAPWRIVVVVSRPVGGVLSTSRGRVGGHPSKRFTWGCLVTQTGEHPYPLFNLAPGGVYPANRVTPVAVRSYRTLSPLPVQWEYCHRRFTFCGTFLQVTLTRR